MRGIRVLHRLNEEHVNVVRRIFELRAEGEGFAAIAKRPDQQLARKKALTAKQEKLQRELERLTDAIASGSGSDTVMSRIQQNERSVREIERELRGLAAPPLDERQVEAILRETLADWPRCTPPARAAGPADAAEAARGQAGDETSAGWAQGGVRFQWGGVARQVTYGLGRISTHGGVPTGIRTRVSALKGPRPRPLDDGDRGESQSAQSCASHKHRILA